MNTHEKIWAAYQMQSASIREIFEGTEGKIDDSTKTLAYLGLESWEIVSHNSGLTLLSPGTDVRELGYPDNSDCKLWDCLHDEIQEEILSEIRESICNPDNFGTDNPIFDFENFKLYIGYFGTHHTDTFRRDYLQYRFYDGNTLIFQGYDFGASPCHAIDSLETCLGLLSFLSLGQGDVEEEYFKDYTSDQIAWRDSSRREELSLLVHDLEMIFGCW